MQKARQARGGGIRQRLFAAVRPRGGGRGDSFGGRGRVYSAFLSPVCLSEAERGVRRAGAVDRGREKRGRVRAVRARRGKISVQKARRNALSATVYFRKFRAGRGIRQGRLYLSVGGERGDLRRSRALRRIIGRLRRARRKIRAALQKMRPRHRLRIASAPRGVDTAVQGAHGRGKRLRVSKGQLRFRSRL